MRESEAASHEGASTLTGIERELYRLDREEQECRVVLKNGLRTKIDAGIKECRGSGMGIDERELTNIKEAVDAAIKIMTKETSDRDTDYASLIKILQRSRERLLAGGTHDGQRTSLLQITLGAIIALLQEMSDLETQRRSLIADYGDVWNRLTPQEKREALFSKWHAHGKAEELIRYLHELVKSDVRDGFSQLVADLLRYIKGEAVSDAEASSNQLKQYADSIAQYLKEETERELSFDPNELVKLMNELIRDFDLIHSLN